MTNEYLNEFEEFKEQLKKDNPFTNPTIRKWMVGSTEQCMNAGGEFLVSLILRSV